MLWLLLGLILLAAVDVHRRRQIRSARELEHERDPRPEGGPQFAGSVCSHCNETIVMQTEGSMCGICSLVIHRACAKAHRVAAHDKGSGYRRSGRSQRD